MAVVLKVSDDNIYQMLTDKGYKINISVRKDGRKNVIFSTRYSIPYKIPTVYANDWSDAEIIKDCSPKLLKWSGLHVVPTLEYR